MILLLMEKKISGNAQAWHKNKMLHHGTILFDADLDFVANVLNVRKDKIESKGIKSNRARVTNVKPYLNTTMTINEFKLKALESLLLCTVSGTTTYALNQNDLLAIHKLQIEKYSNWTWNYGESPKSKIVREKRFPGGYLKIHFDLMDGIIKNLEIYGDFLDRGNIKLINETLMLLPYDEKTCREKLRAISFDSILLSISLDEFLSCLF